MRRHRCAFLHHTLKIFNPLSPRVFQRREAIARRDAGEALVDIGRSYGVSYSTISRLRLWRRVHR